MLLERDPNPWRKWRDRSRAKWENVSTLRSLTIANDRYVSFKQVYGQVENLRRNCLYFGMMIRCWKQIPVLQGNWSTGREPKEKVFILCDDDLLLLIDVRPLSKLMDRSRAEGETVSTLWWWSVAPDGSPSFKQIDGQLENRRRKCFYFAMMICCSWWMPVRQRHLGTGQELGGAIDSTLVWWSLSVMRCHCEYAIQHSQQCAQQPSNNGLKVQNSKPCCFSVSFILFPTSKVNLVSGS